MFAGSILGLPSAFFTLVGALEEVIELATRGADHVPKDNNLLSLGTLGGPVSFPNTIHNLGEQSSINRQHSGHCALIDELVEAPFGQWDQLLRSSLAFPTTRPSPLRPAPALDHSQWGPLGIGDGSLLEDFYGEPNWPQANLDQDRFKRPRVGSSIAILEGNAPIVTKFAQESSTYDLACNESIGDSHKYPESQQPDQGEQEAGTRAPQIVASTWHVDFNEAYSVQDPEGVPAAASQKFDLSKARGIPDSDPVLHTKMRWPESYDDARWTKETSRIDIRAQPPDPLTIHILGSPEQQSTLEISPRLQNLKSQTGTSGGSSIDNSFQPKCTDVPPYTIDYFLDVKKEMLRKGNIVGDGGRWALVDTLLNQLKVTPRLNGRLVLPAESICDFLQLSFSCSQTGNKKRLNKAYNYLEPLKEALKHLQYHEMIQNPIWQRRNLEELSVELTRQLTECFIPCDRNNPKAMRHAEKILELRPIFLSYVRIINSIIVDDEIYIQEKVDSMQAQAVKFYNELWKRLEVFKVFKVLTKQPAKRAREKISSHESLIEEIELRLKSRFIERPSRHYPCERLGAMSWEIITLWLYRHRRNLFNMLMKDEGEIPRKFKVFLNKMVGVTAEHSSTVLLKSIELHSNHIHSISLYQSFASPEPNSPEIVIPNATLTRQSLRPCLTRPVLQISKS